MPGMLDGRRRADGGRRAGLTSSPDFFLSMGGFLLLFLHSSSLISPSEAVDGVSEVSAGRKSTKAVGSVLDLLWPSFRGTVAGRSTCTGVGFFSRSSASMIKASPCSGVSPNAAAFAEPELEKPPLCCSIIRTAACSSARFSNCRSPGPAFASSSSLEFTAESGGEMTAPTGILESSVTGGGDCRRRAMPIWPASYCFPSEVVGGLESWEGPKTGARFETVLRWRVRYDVDRGSSDFVEAAGPHEGGCCHEGRRVTLGDVLVEAVGDR